MASYDNLPVYKTTYELLSYFYKIGKNIHRDYRYTLAERLKNELTDVLVLIYKVNLTNEKAELLESARDKIMIVKIQLRLLSDLKQISLKQFALCVEMVESISKQLASWQKSNEERIQKKKGLSGNESFV